MEEIPQERQDWSYNINVKSIRELSEAKRKTVI